MSEVDFGKAADDYCEHRVGFPSVLFERLAEKEREKTDLRREHRKTAQAGVEKDW